MEKLRKAVGLVLPTGSTNNNSNIQAITKSRNIWKNGDEI